MAYQRSRSLGVGAKIIRRRKSLTPICHCSRDQPISLTPITNPSQLPTPANQVPSQIYPIPLRISPWLWFSITMTIHRIRHLSSSSGRYGDGCNSNADLLSGEQFLARDKS